MTEVDLNTKNFRFEVREVAPGTSYPDEPSVLIDPGWVVVGWSDDNDECAELILRVDQAEDPKAAAEFVAARLSAATQTAEQAQPAEIRALTAQRNDAQRAGLKFVAQLDEIRAVVAEWQTNPEATGGGGMEAIRAILKRRWVSGYGDHHTGRMLHHLQR